MLGETFLAHHSAFPAGTADSGHHSHGGEWPVSCGHSGVGGIGFLYCTVALFCLLVGISFWSTLRWGKEAEEFESHPKDAGKIERERHRRKKWTER
jgi:hypothetical protein